MQILSYINIFEKCCCESR